MQGSDELTDRVHAGLEKLGEMPMMFCCCLTVITDV